MSEAVWVPLLFLGIFGIPVYIGLLAWWRDCHDPVQIADRAQRAKRDQYVIEYLTYGYDHEESLKKANVRMKAEAQAAERVT